ncbi:MAG: hypothetical protein ACOZJX_09580 [Pseudomonadota bacterium]
MNTWVQRATLRPGQPAALRYTGPQAWLGRLAQGRRADQLPALMAAVHTLCAHGHALAARLAWRAALGERALPTPAERTHLALAVARDHLLRMAHDWPRLLPAGGERLALAGAPPWQPGLEEDQRLARLPDWLEQHWLHCPAGELREALATEPVVAALDWARSARTPLARLMARELPSALALPTPHRPLAAPASCPPTEALASVTHGLPDTGAWCRAHDAHPAAAHNAGMRLIARLLDLLRLATPGGTGWLQASGHPGAPGRGHAWVEVGRGRLGYELTLADSGDRATVQSLQVLSPTDWNLHPRGVLAEALAQAGDTAAAARLAVAFDPCVPFEIETPAEAACA